MVNSTFLTVLVILLGLIASALCEYVHCESLRIITNFVGKFRTAAKARMTVLILLLLSVHVIEIWIFGFAFFFAEEWIQTGNLVGPRFEGFMEYIYFSGVTYTTIGYGDLVPLGPIRFIAAVEALTGLLMIAWSASLTYLEMQRFWKIS